MATETEKLDHSMKAIEERARIGPPEHVLKNDADTRARFEAREKLITEHQRVLARTHSASGNAFARQGMNNQDIVKAVGLLRGGKSFDDVKKLMPEVSEKALDAYRDELERRAALPPGGERILLGPPKSKEG